MAFLDAQQSSYWRLPPFNYFCSHFDGFDYRCVYDCSKCSFPSPTPPPPSVSYYRNSSHSNSYAGIVAAIAIIATVFLFLPFFIVAYKWCLGSRRRRQHLQTGEAAHHDNAWRITVNGGLEESVIRSIATCKYRRGDGFVDGTDCAICLGEFKEDESLRLLPKCSHAFHIHCIDTWLKSQSNCPLCRAIVIAMPPPPVVQQEEAPAAAPSQQTGNDPSAATAGGGEGQSSR